MALDSVTQLAYLGACVLSLLLTVLFTAQVRNNNLHWSIIVAAAAQSAWLLTIGLNAKPQHIVLAESLYFSAWIIATVLTTEHLSEKRLPALYKLILYNTCGAIIAFNLVTVGGLQALPIDSLFVSQGIFFAILGLFNVEQLYRNVSTIRLVKLVCLSIAAVFVYDVYFFSQSLVQRQSSSGSFQIRAAVIIVTSLFMGLAAITLRHQHDQHSRLSFSRPVVFYTTSLTLACILLVVVTLGGYYVQVHGGEWGFVGYSLLLAGAMLTITFVFSSASIREQLTVLINKHLFSHKYDYRSEWLKLIERLSQPTSPEDVHHHALGAVGAIFKSQGGALWLRRGKLLVPVYQQNIQINIPEAIEPDSSSFVQALERSEWVFLPSSTSHADPLSQHNEHLPDWAAHINDIWLILPLINENKLIGFMVLTAPNGDTSLNWEDLDLLKTVGRQVANYLERHEQAEQLAEARQFDAFNKLAAYVMHDLKNLIAQQSLVVKNAERHKDNPAFVEDAIQTIHNSVTRMNSLLHKLQRKEAETVQVLNLQAVLVEAVRRCQKFQPLPTLRSDNENIRVMADRESLVMLFVHLIHNAQDATPASGFIDVEVSQEANMVWITIEDNGDGMDAEFIRDRLFKPFDTTKSGKGMGIGVYQARDYVQSLAGNLSVDSTPGEGTTFTISLPIVAA